MNQIDQNINKDMIDSDLIDVDSMDFGDDQTWLYKVPHDSGQKVDIVDWNLSCDWANEDEAYLQMEKDLNELLDNIIKNNHDYQSLPDRQKFDSRTYVRPKKRLTRPSIQSIVEVSSPSSLSSNSSTHPSLLSGNKYLTYNKYNNPLSAISPLMRLKTFNVDTNSDNSALVKDYAMKRRSLIQDEDPQVVKRIQTCSPDLWLQRAGTFINLNSDKRNEEETLAAHALEDADITVSSEPPGRFSMDGRLSDHTPSKPINIDLSQPAHNLHNTFNKGLTNIMNERGSLNMYQSGESLMRMSPPSLVSSLLMESSGQFNPESLDGRRSIITHRDSGIPPGRESIDPMMTSMTLSILDEKDMSTSFLSQTTYPDNDSLIDSLPPSLVNSVNSSYLVNSSKPTDETNIFSSATFTHLEQSEKLLSARPRCQLFGSMRRESGIKNSESYTKSREEACQIDTMKILNENADKKESLKLNMAETITLHFANNKFRSDAEKENFERDDTFYKDMGIPNSEEGRNSLNVNLGKQELNEIIQARQKLSLARKALPGEPEKLPTQDSPVKTILLPNQTITVPKQSMENASELLSRRRLNGLERDREEPPTRDTPKRNATFKKLSPRANAIDATVVYMHDDPQANDIIDINSATLNLIDGERTLQQEEWGSQERAMVGSSESTDTGTFSSSSPPDSVPDTAVPHDPHSQVSSTPLTALRKGAKNDLLNLHTTISPIYDVINDKSYTLTRAPSSNDMHSTVINSATLVRCSAKRDILAMRLSPDRRMPPPTRRISPPSRSPPGRIPTASASYGCMAPPSGVPRRSALPTSKLRQYSSHRELNRIPTVAVMSPSQNLRGPANRTMLRRNVYASNPALSPTSSKPVYGYSLAAETQVLLEKDKPARPVLTNPPPLVRQGTETLRRERPQSQLVAPKDPPTTRPYSISGTSQLRVNTVNRPASGQPVRPAPANNVVEHPRPASSNEARHSGLPRPSRLPAPRRALRPPSVYSVAPTGDADNY